MIFPQWNEMIHYNLAITKEILRPILSISHKDILFPAVAIIQMLIFIRASLIVTCNLSILTNINERLSQQAVATP